MFYYSIKLTTGAARKGAFITKEGRWAEIAPLPGFSQETLEEALQDVSLPSASFAIESLSLPFPAPRPIPTSLLLMGSRSEIMERAARFPQFKSAKLKVSQLSWDEARELIDKLADRFHLRIDVNRAWDVEKSLAFFSRYPKEAFDYVEEPFNNPRELARFTHPLAVDESFPSDLSLFDLEKLPTLKAIIYKPTLQGGLKRAKPIKEWADSHGIRFIASSSFETDLGLSHVLAFAQRLELTDPVGIGTYHYLDELVCDDAIQFLGPNAIIQCAIPIQHKGMKIIG